MDPQSARRRARRVIFTAVLDVLLLPLAIIVVLLDDVLWNAALRLLRRLERLGLLRGAQGWVAGLPAAAVLPLFLLPEATSHLAGFLGAFLLAKGKVGLALVLLVIVKGLATLTIVWIYQAASHTLLSISWFAWLHGAVQYVREWSLAQVAPLRNALRARLTSKRGIGGAIRRRFRALRDRLTALFRGTGLSL